MPTSNPSSKCPSVRVNRTWLFHRGPPTLAWTRSEAESAAFGSMCTQSCNKRRLHVPKADGCWDGSSASRWTNSVPELIAANDFQKKDTWRYPRLSRRLRAGTSCHALLPEHLTVQFGPQDVVFAGLVLHAPCSILSCFQPTMIARDDP